MTNIRIYTVSTLHCNDATYMKNVYYPVLSNSYSYYEKWKNIRKKKLRLAKNSFHVDNTIEKNTLSSYSVNSPEKDHKKTRVHTRETVSVVAPPSPFPKSEWETLKLNFS